MKTIVISVFQSFISRNILNTGVLAELLSDSSVRVVLLVPAKKIDFYTTEYANDRVIVEPFDFEAVSGRLEKMFEDFAWLLVNSNIKRFQEIKRFDQHKSRIRYWYHRFVIATLSPLSIAHHIFRHKDRYINRVDAFADIIARYQPDTIFATDVFGHPDALLMKSARRHGVYLVGMVRSWDNPTSKHLLRVIPDVLLVHNEILKEEVIQLHDVPEKIIRVVGIPHYEYYRTYQPISRAEYCAKLGIDPHKRIILFSPAGEKFIATDGQMAEIIRRGYAAGVIPADTVLLIRIHPSNPTSLSGFTPDEHCVVERPGISFAGTTERDKELGVVELHHLLDTLTHSAVVINVLSSIVIDAAVLDRPVITIGFEGWETDVPFGNSVARYHADENMEKLLAIGGTPVVRSPEELYAHIQKYLAEPGTDHDGRERIVSRQCNGLDGHAKERIAQAVLVR
jgi:hypothetical protein